MRYFKFEKSKIYWTGAFFLFAGYGFTRSSDLITEENGLKFED